jgi:hypothetical protein
LTSIERKRKKLYLPDAKPAAIWLKTSLKLTFLAASSRAETPTWKT